jgi:branched-chain amino acid transport system ATP-binding protein
MIAFDLVNAHYGKNHVLTNVTLKVGKGEVVSLIGANAAGKTTALRTAMGLKETTSGILRLDGEDITRLRTHERVGRGLVLVPEGRQVFVKFTVMENLLMGAYHRADRNKASNEIAYAFSLFPKLEQRAGQRAGVMSGGEQQMLAIARGLMAKPKCLLLDEPTLGLAPIVVEEIAATVRLLAGSGMTILLAEQNVSMALACSTRAYVLESGSISLQGLSEEMRKTDSIRTLYLGETGPAVKSN